MSNEPTIAELKARIAELEAQATAKNKLTLKISEKGGVSLYGLGRFPVTLYFEQWLRVIELGSTIKAFIEANRSKLKTKAEAKAA